jgi:hypothetical protein
VTPAIISLLIPTYNRAGELFRTLNSIYKTVHDPEHLEIVVHAVDGDEDTFKVLGSWVNKVITSDRVGWDTVCETFNEMAAACTGDWLFMICDDTTCHTYGWDEIIRKYDHAVPALLTPRETHSELAIATFGDFEHFLYPIISRPAYEKLGCLTQTIYHDAWLHEVFKTAGIQEQLRIPIYFTDRIFGGKQLVDEEADVQRAFWASIEPAAAQLRGELQ